MHFNHFDMEWNDGVAVEILGSGQTFVFTGPLRLSRQLTRQSSAKNTEDRNFADTVRSKLRATHVTNRNRLSELKI